MRLYLSMECDECENEFYQLTLVLQEHRGLPVVPWTIAEQSRFVCPRCDTVHYTGDTDLYVERGTKTDVDDDDDEDHDEVEEEHDGDDDK